jgi:hypothetical protein
VASSSVVIDPDKLRKEVELPDEDRSNIEILVSKYEELSRYKEDLMTVIPAHDLLLIDVLSRNNPKGLLYEHHLLLQGFLVRSRLLMEAIIREVVKGNFPASINLVRAQCETLVSACYVEKFPDKLKEVLYADKDHKTNILTQLSHAEKKYNGLTKDYDSLSEIVHPNMRSHFAPIKVENEKAGKIHFSSGGWFEKDDAIMTIRLALSWTKWVLETIRSVDRIYNK